MKSVLKTLEDHGWGVKDGRVDLVAIDKDNRIGTRAVVVGITCITDVLELCGRGRGKTRSMNAEVVAVIVIGRPTPARIEASPDRYEALLL